MLNEDLAYIEVLKPGISSIQDGGRFGYLSQGIPVSGFMDSIAAGYANLLVGNSINMACIEWAMLPPKLLFNEASVIAVTGVQVQVYVNGVAANTYKSVYIPKNGVLSFGTVNSGVYGYIAISKGFKTEMVLGSRSWYLQITKNHLMAKGIYLPFYAENKFKGSNSKVVSKIETNEKKILEVTKGPEFYLLTKKQQLLLLKGNYSLSVHRNRMGIQLKEPFVKHQLSILSGPVLPGTVQWTPSGNLIVLMKDAQTIGGYPRILQLTEKALSELSNFVGIVVFELFL